MTNEEEEVIEETKKKIESTQKGLKEGRYYGEHFNLEREIKREQILLNLIDKLQKENEKLKEEIENWKFTHKYVEENYIHKDKIRTKIKELEQDQVLYETRQVLKELLGEE